MSVHNAHPARGARQTQNAQRGARGAVARLRVLDRLFLGGCIATYLVLMAAVVAALKAYGL